MQKMDGSPEMSSFGSGAMQEMPSTLPGYVTFFSLVFQLLMTLVIFIMAGWVFVTIKTTRSLHKPHSIFVANLMVTDMILAVLQTAVTIDYVIGVDLLSCNVRQFFFSPIVEVHFTYLMISVDKVIGIAFPYKHRKIMTPRVVASMLVTTWTLAMLLSADSLISNYKDVPQYDLCASLIVISQRFVIRILPILLASSLTVSLNVYLSIKAYNVSKQAEKITRFSGNSSTSGEVKSLKKKYKRVKKDLKPLITLLMLIIGSSLVAFLFLLLLNTLKLVWSHQTILEALRPNISYVILFLHPTVYGLYFKQVRDPMVKKYKQLRNRYKFNTAVVAPLPPRAACAATKNMYTPKCCT